MKRSRDRSIIGRREFLKRGMLAGVGVSILPLAGAASASKQPLRFDRRSDTSWSGELTSPGKRHAIPTIAICAEFTG